MASATVASSPTAAISRSQRSSTLINHLLRSLATLEPNSTASSRIDALCSHRSACQGNLRTNCSVTHFRSLPNPRGELLLPSKDCSVLHDKLHALEHLDVAQRVSIHRDDVGISARSHHSDLSLHIEHHGRAGRGTLNRIHRLHTEFHHAREFLGNRLGPRNSAHVGAEDDFHPTFQRLLERNFV